MSSVTVDNVKEFFKNLGGMHDARVELINFNPYGLLVALEISDINSNFYGLPEYKGERPCSLLFKEVQSLFIDTVPLEGICIGNITIENEAGFFVASIYLNVGPGELSYKSNMSNIQIVFGTLEISDAPPKSP